MSKSFPLFSDAVSAGFPSPASDYIEQPLDFVEFCIEHPAATFFVRVSGESMKDAGIFDGDLLVVDRSLNASHGDIIVARVGSEFTVKELCLKPTLMLLAHNSAFKPIKLGEGDDFEIFGVVSRVVRKLR